jgi:Tol biopolymer transport system component
VADEDKVSTYSFNDQKKSAQIRILDIESGDSRLLTEESNASEPVWLGDDEVLHLKKDEQGKTTLVVSRIKSDKTE